jgi:hypothetical protein
MFKSIPLVVQIAGASSLARSLRIAAIGAAKVKLVSISFSRLPQFLRRLLNSLSFIRGFDFAKTTT